MKPFALHAVKPEDIVQNYARIHAILEKVCDDVNGLDSVQVIRELVNGTVGQQLFVLNDYEAVFLCELRQRQRNTSFCIAVCAGEGVVKITKELLELFESYAKIYGCHGVEIVGRKGWGKLVGDDYQHAYTSVYKVL